ncbi:hypothetical protein ANTRET_LOCUS3974 [Anthophora retusa]
MSQRRRRANDFTDSLNSFQYTSSEIGSDTLCSTSQDSLDDIRSKNTHVSTDSTYSSKHSIILAGSSSKHSSVQNTFVSMIASSAIQSAPDLNERINSFQAEHLSNKIDDKENDSPQYCREDKELDNNDMFTTLVTVSKIQVTDEHDKLNTNVIDECSKRDSNYNIHSSKCNVIPTSEQYIPKMIMSQCISSPNCINKETQTCDTNCTDKNPSNETNKFETLLCSLDNKFNQMKEVSQSEILKHLSDEFIHSPKNFTEKLLTIIEESVMNIDDNSADVSATNLSRLTMEFRKMCKFIEDESAPDWPPSPLSTPPCLQQIFTSPACNRSVDIKTCKNEKLTSSINRSAPTTPISGIDIIKRRFFNKISRNNSNRSPDNIFNESTNTSFERLEAQCKRLFPEEREYCKPLRKSLSMPSLISMNQIQDICEQQMASLNISNGNENHKESTIVTVPNVSDECLHQSSSDNKSELSCSKLQEYHDQLKNTEYENMSYSKKKSKRISEKPDFSEITPEKFTNNYAAVDPDELEKTLLQGIAEKRKRCLDTARLISEINKDPEAIEAQKTLKISPTFSTNNELGSSSNDETKFLKTLMSCKDYQAYLQRHKPFFMLLQNSNPSTPEASLRNIEKSGSECETSNIKKTPCTKSVTSSPNTMLCNLPKSPLSQKRSKEKRKKEEIIRPKLFITPGKSPPNQNYKRKKVYFPTMNSPVENTARNHILESPHVKGLYRLNYNTVLSPIGMYIRGTDMQLIKNVRPKKDRLLLTPMKENTKPSPNRNSRQNTPSNSITPSQEKASLKINLSPKVHTNATSKQKVFKTKTLNDDDTPKNHFVLPKVSYKLPLHVKTIKENKLPNAGTRVKKMLETAQSKVVIRHHGRINSVQKRKCKTNGEYEIHYEPEDESIHIEQTATKTNFIQKRTNI